MEGEFDSWKLSRSLALGGEGKRTIIRVPFGSWRSQTRNGLRSGFEVGAELAAILKAKVNLTRPVFSRTGSRGFIGGCL